MLNLSELRRANCARLPQFKNAHGEPAHSCPFGSDWALSAWSNAVAGELGEAANLIKKIERGDISLDRARPALAREFADVLVYLDILAFRAGVDLGLATLVKFNEVSRRVGATVFLTETGVVDVAPVVQAEVLAFWLDGGVAMKAEPGGEEVRRSPARPFRAVDMGGGHAATSTDRRVDSDRV